MEKEKVTNKYTVLDAFKGFFYMFISTAVLSLIFDIVLRIVASANGQEYATLVKSDLVRIITCVLSPTIMICFYFIYNHKRKIKQTEALSDGEKISLLPISIAIVLAIIAIFMFTPFMNFLDYVFSSWGYVADNTLPMQDKMTQSGGYLILGIFVFALLPAIAEELIFRGIIQKALLSRFSGFVSIMITALLFTLVHGSLQQSCYQFIVAIMLGYLACVGGSILYSFILHFLSNALVVVFSCHDIVGYLSVKEAAYYNVFSEIFPILIFLLGCILVGILFWVLKYLRNKNFFRFENGKLKVRTEPVDTQEKVKCGQVWRNLELQERVYMITSFAVIIVLWIANTVAGFMG